MTRVRDRLLAATVALAWVQLGACLMLTPEQKVEATSAHNRLRASAYPQGGNLNYFTWNTRLEGLAQAAANSCVFEHNYGGAYASLGENLYLGGRTNVSDMITLFYMEHLAYNFSTAQCNRPNVFNFHSCGHYTQIVGSTVKEVGCAIAACANGNLFVCEYDKMAPSPAYSAGPPCSTCFGTSFCYEGLCVNGTMRDDLVNNRNKTVTCSLLCKNCGTRVELIGLDPSICMCTCKSGYSGSDCSTRSSTAADPTCSKCIQLNTPCQNGGIDSNSTSSCNCTCVGNFTGPQCQLATDAYTDAIYLTLRNRGTFCSNGQCTSVPNTPVTFASQVWPTLQSILVAAVNAYCRSSGKYAECCGAGAVAPSGGASGDLLVNSDMRYVDFSVSVNSTGDLSVAIFASAKSDNALCSPAAGRRKRRAAATTSSVSISILNSTIESSNSSLSVSLANCCSISITGAGSYKTVVDVQFGYTTSEGGGGGGGNSAPSPRSSLVLALPLLILPMIVWLSDPRRL